MTFARPDLVIAELMPYQATFARSTSVGPPSTHTTIYMRPRVARCGLTTTRSTGCRRSRRCWRLPSPNDTDVVDHELRVRGVAGLRIADASVLPFQVSGNTAAPRRSSATAPPT